MARIRPITQVKSGPATVSGAGIAPNIGSGSAQAAVSSILGSGARILTAGGVLVAQNATVSGQQDLTNAVRIANILSGRTPHFSYSTPADPVTTNEVTVHNAADFNTYAALGGYRITVGSSFSGNVSITASDTDVVMSNSLTISGYVASGLGGGSPYYERIRWTGGNIGNIAFARVRDVLFDDVYALAVSDYEFTAGSPEHIFGWGNPASRIAIINSTLELENDPGAPANTWAWALHTDMSDGGANGSDFFVGNSLFLTNQQTTRFISNDNIMIVDSVFNPDGGAGYGLGILGNGFRIHYESNHVWIRDSWGVGFMQLNAVNGADTDPEVLDALFDNFDRYAEDYAIYANANTGTIQNSTCYGGNMVYGTLTNGGGNTEESWDGTTVPDYSGVGAIRP